MSRPLTPEHNKQHEVIPSLPSFTQSTIAPDRKLRGPGISSNTLSETLSSFENLTGICWKLSQGNDLETAERVLWAYLPKIVSLALPPSPRQPTAAKIVSQSYLLAASLAGHHNDLKARQDFCEQALLFGNVAQDRNLQIAALRQLATTYDFLRRPDKVLQTYQQALPYLSEASPLLHALIYAGISGTYAQLEWRQEAVRYLGMAYETFPVKPEDDPYFLYANGGYSTLIFCDGLNHLDFHQPQEAEKIFAQIDGLGPKMHVSEKVRISLLNCQATIFIELNDIEQACLYLEEAVKASLILGSKKLYHESLEIFAQMKGRWEGEKRIKSLGDLFQA
jgi:tetratricopeptide (TPR) repeat protein